MIKRNVFVFACKSVFASKKQYLLASSGIILGIVAQILSMSLCLSYSIETEKAMLNAGVSIIKVQINSIDEHEAVQQLKTTDNIVSNPVKTYQEKRRVLILGQKKDSTIMFTEGSYFDLTHVNIIEGSFEEADSDVNSVIINSTFANSLNKKNLIGQAIEISDIPFIITGIIEDGLYNEESVCYIDYNYIYKSKIRKIDNVWLFKCESLSMNNLQAIDTQFNKYLQNRYYNKIQMLEKNIPNIQVNTDVSNKLYSVITKLNEYQSFENTINIIQNITIFFFAILLVVGSLCVRNIFRILSDARKREIGVAKAVGALRKTILFQFIVEISCVIFFSVLLGTILGIGLSLLAESLLGLSLSLSFTWIIASILIASVLTFVFGVAPAFKCAKQDPIILLK